MRDQELARFEEEKLMNHARTTQVVFEDVSKVLINKNKQEEKAKVERIKHKLMQEYEEKDRKRENYYSMIIAKERKQRSYIELKNAELESQMYEMVERLKMFESEKENYNTTGGTNSNYTSKDLIQKLKKLNKTLPIK